MAPRKGMKYGGIELDSGTARGLLLVADETAGPAVCTILEDLPVRARGTVLLEVPDLDGRYAWIAGESAVVTSMRRLLVNELGMDRRQVACTGYWRRGS